MALDLDAVEEENLADQQEDEDNFDQIIDQHMALYEQQRAAPQVDQEKEPELSQAFSSLSMVHEAE